MLKPSSQRARRGRESLSVGQERLVGSTRGSEEARSASQMAEMVWKALQEGWEGLGGPSGEPNGSGGPRGGQEGF